MVDILELIFNVVTGVIFVYLGLFAVYFLIFGLAGLFYRERRTGTKLTPAHFAILIPAYKEDIVIPGVARSAANHVATSCSFDVYVIADSLKDETVEQLKGIPVNVIVVSFENSTKSKALNRAFNILGDNYDYAVILDADNIMAPGFLDNIHGRLKNGFEVVQGHRQDKNQNTRFAVLDAVSEGVNNSIFRRGHRRLGLSAALIGSGFAARYGLLKSIMAEIQAVGGFDKELEIRLIREKIRIGFADKAVVLDEKVQKSTEFANQRRRWLSAQFVYFSRYFTTAARELFTRGNIDLFDKVMQMISPPRVLQLGLTALLAVVTGLFSLSADLSNWIFPGFCWWVALFLASVLAVMVSVPRKFYNRRTLMALMDIPGAFILMFLALLNLKGANKSFIHTKHGEE